MKLHYMGDANLGPRGGKLYVFHCPGCHAGHPFEVTEGGTGWTWNGSFDRPSFTPSLLINRSDPASLCHLFVHDGRIQFLSDCHHGLAGQIVDMPDWDHDEL